MLLPEEGRDQAVDVKDEELEQYTLWLDGGPQKESYLVRNSTDEFVKLQPRLTPVLAALWLVAKSDREEQRPFDGWRSRRLLHEILNDTLDYRIEPRTLTAYMALLVKSVAHISPEGIRFIEKDRNKGTRISNRVHITVRELRDVKPEIPDWMFS